jgi:hypothetical protein
MSSEEKQQPTSKSGFGGLGSMVSDVDGVIRQAEQNATTRPPSGAAPSDLPPPQSENPKSPPAQEPLYSGSQKATSASSSKKWLLGIGAVIGTIWLLSTVDHQPSQRQIPTVAAPSPTRQNSIPGPNEQTYLTEERPPLGVDIVLGPAQLRYCLAEKIRIESARSVLNNYIARQVSKFNSMVNDYNDRCSRFRYRRGTLESARAEVERFRLKLEAEGRNRL